MVGDTVESCEPVMVTVGVPDLEEEPEGVCVCEPVWTGVLAAVPDLVAVPVCV
jgi:hypothetical protein